MGDIFKDKNEPIVAMTEYIEVDSILGGDEGKECTYSKGYMNKHVVFSFLTCVPTENVGICMAFSLTCHNGHEKERWTSSKDFTGECAKSNAVTIGYNIVYVVPLKLDRSLNEIEH
eukprot:Gb_12978 [translate_table: standard]